jgi:sugar phosphate isomerase/epimerase
MRIATMLQNQIPIRVLAVNHINDLGLALENGAANPNAIDTLERALNCAHLLDIRVLHVPGFRRSMPRTKGLREGTVVALRRICELVSTAGITLAYESPLGAIATLALAEMVNDPSLRVVLDTGNLIDAGEDPRGFADVIGKADLLSPDLHLKDPTRTPDDSHPRSHELLSILLDQITMRSVLVENNYRHDSDRLSLDIAQAREVVTQRQQKEAR